MAQSCAQEHSVVHDGTMAQVSVTTDKPSLSPFFHDEKQAEQQAQPACSWAVKITDSRHRSAWCLPAYIKNSIDSWNGISAQSFAGCRLKAAPRALVDKPLCFLGVSETSTFCGLHHTPGT